MNEKELTVFEIGRDLGKQCFASKQMPRFCSLGMYHKDGIGRRGIIEKRKKQI
jgi:hypothetical protein